VRYRSSDVVDPIGPISEMEIDARGGKDRMQQSEVEEMFNRIHRRILTKGVMTMAKISSSVCSKFVRRMDPRGKGIYRCFMSGIPSISRGYVFLPAKLLRNQRGCRDLGQVSSVDPWSSILFV
jgi:hypothetical protein